VPPRRPSEKASTRFGASAKLALERSLPIAVARHENRITSDHVLLGVLEAEVGTVPRSLALAGVDRAELAASV
jgi:D-alanyl-D-alanine carboxypeptidase